ncbi:MAG: hypothetical protein EP330_16670 [Deltaproteobacteria bacterium]|nr:MAG: hypothetical protein EP330_16670 [Deltaproteobacteria bacterium]
MYAVLAKLEEAGAVFAVGDKPQRFVPTDPDSWMATRRREREAREAAAAEALARLPKRVRPEPIWTISRYEQVLDRMGQMMAGAQASITLSIWARELAQLEGPLRAAAGRPLHRVLYSPEPVRAEGFACWCDTLDDPTKAAWSHKVVLVVDHREALIGGSEPDAENHAVWTTNPSLIDLAVNHVILDITRLATQRGVDPTGDVAPMMRPHL